jgi:outer membrane immunogenic protein
LIWKRFAEQEAAMKLLPLSLSVVVAGAAGSAAAHAADLGVRPAYSPAPPPPPAYSWTGFYLGGNGGFGGNKFQYPFSVGGPIPALGIAAATSGTASLNSSGFFGGGQAGVNWQAGSAWVMGVESDFDWADIEGKAATSATLFSGSVGTKLDWFGTVRGRVGFLVTPSALLYGTGGWAYGHTTSSANTAAFGLAAAGSVGHEKNGWTAGGGLEYALNPWLSFKTEYLYLDLGTDAIVNGAVAGVPVSVSEKTTAHTVKAGINVKFGGW